MGKLLKRLTPRFSVRTLFVIVVLVAAYFGAWEWTHRAMVKRWPTSKSTTLSTVAEFLPVKDGWTFDRSTPIPFVVQFDVCLFDHFPEGYPRRYHLFLFGRTFKLPFESTWRNN